MLLSDRIGRRMKLQDLHVLMTVAQTGSMSKAAERLNTSQPNISRSIVELEQALGVCLFDRHRLGVTPTEYGRTLLEGGVAVFDELRQAVKKVERLADPSMGNVRIATASFLAMSFVSAVIDRVYRRYPRVVFDIVTLNAERLSRELTERNVDCLITRRFDRFADEKLDFENLYDESYVVVAGSQNPWVRRHRIDLAKLMDEAWVLPPPDSLFGHLISEAFQAHGLTHPRATIFTMAPEVRIGLLTTGHFLTIAPVAALRLPIQRTDLKVLPVKLPIAPMPIGIVTLKNRTLNPVAQLFIEHARAVAKPLAKGKL